MPSRQPDSKQVISPMVTELADALRNYIYQECRPGQKIPTEIELSRQHGRAIKTIRKALALLSEEGLIVRRQGSGTYVSRDLPHQTGTTGMICFGSPADLLMAPYLREPYRGMLESVPSPDRNLHVLLGYETRPGSIEPDFTSRLDMSEIDSVICLEVLNQDLLAKLGRIRPTVAVDLDCRLPGVSSCSVNHHQNMELAVEHLRRLGHRRIGLLGNVSPRATDPAVRERIAAYRKLLLDADLPFDQSWIMPADFDEGLPGGFDRWRRTPALRRPTAFICIDFQWLIALTAVSEGISIPGDLSLLGIGELDAWPDFVRVHVRRNEGKETPLARLFRRANSMDPALAELRMLEFTSVHIHFREMGRWAVHEVMRRIGRPDLEPAHEAFSGSLEPGNTVGPPQ